MKNILQHLELNSKKFPEKVLFTDIDSSYTFSQVCEIGKSIGTALAGLKATNKPIAIICKRDCKVLLSMMGVMYSGNFYVVIDSESPIERINKIFDILHPIAVVCESAIDMTFDCERFCIEEIMHSNINTDTLAKIRSRQISCDPAYTLFTSGSTGVPKGAVLTHQNVMTYIEWFVHTFGIDESTVFGNQTPFYFSMSVSDIYASIVAGATFNIIPKSYFSFPMELVKFLNDRKVNTIYWVPSAMSIVANIKLFDYAIPKYLHTVLFAGEVMPNKQLNYWRKYLPTAKYCNLFGPTETTDICTYYVVDREFENDESLPIGKACDNCDTFILDDNNNLITDKGIMGELYVRGGFVGSGYYNNAEKTNINFVQNPINPHYPEIVYKTGDLVQLNERGEYIYLCRKDFQIKHMGYRIELGEIETAASSIEKIDSAVCVFDKEKDLIVLIYSGRIKVPDVASAMRDKVPNYMQPNVVAKTMVMPYNQNGKIDRNWLSNNYQQL